MRQEEKDKISGFEAARARLTSIAYRMLGSRAEAEDIVQDAWLKWHAAAEGDLRTPAAWLTTVTTRLAIDRIRRLQSEQTARTNESLTQPWMDEVAPSAEDEALRAAAVSEAVALLFERLSDDERAAFVLHEAFECDYAEIADVVGKTPAHCRQLAHRARQRLASGKGGEGSAQRRNADTNTNDPAHAASVERLRHLIHRADTAGVMRTFADREATVAHAGAGRAGVIRRVGLVATQQEEPLTHTTAATLEAYALPPDWGAAVALVHECDIVGVLRVVDVRDGFGRVSCQIALVTRGAEIDALNHRFGKRAIRELIARACASPSLMAA
jgi:RNA polymerase sigma-70 factor (ECF subfamily)